MLEIHVAVLLFGLAGLFGKFLSLPAFVIVLGRTSFAMVVLLFFLILGKGGFKTRNRKDLMMLALQGVILSVHWVAFFYSIQISTVAIGLLTFSTFPLFVTFLEPYFFKESLKMKDVILAICILIGMVLVIPEFDFSNNITQGVFWGVVSGFTFAILSLLNRRYVQTYSAQLMAFYQNGVAAITLIPFLLAYEIKISLYEFFMLMILGVFCTALAHALFIKSLTKVKAQLAAIIAGLEPVYGILFAMLLLSEFPSTRTWLGGAVILSTVLISSLQKKSA